MRPRTQDEAIAKVSRLGQRLSTHAATVNIPPEEVQSAELDALTINFVTNELVPATKARYQAAVALKDSLIKGKIGSATAPFDPDLGLTMPVTLAQPGILERYVSLSDRIIAHPAITPAMVQDMSLGSTATTQAELTMPEFTATALPGSEVRLDWVKLSSNGVIIEARRGNAIGTDGGWEQLGVDHQSPFVDVRAPLAEGQPERREYRLRYLDGDDPVGEWSNRVVVSTTP